MPEQMNYSTYGRSRRRSNRPTKNQPKRSTATSAVDHSSRQNRVVDPKDKKIMTSAPHSIRRRSDPDGAYCVSREKRAGGNKDAKDRDRNDSRGRPQSQSRAVVRGKSQPPSAKPLPPPPRRRSGSEANSSMRQSRSTTRSPSPKPRSNKAEPSTSQRRASSVRPSRPRTQTFSEQRHRSNSLKSCRSTKSCVSTKSEMTKLTSQLSEFDLKTQNRAAVKNKSAKNYLISKISTLSIIGGCKKKHSKPPQRRRQMPRNTRNRRANTSTSKVVPKLSVKQVYQVEDGSCTYRSEEDMSSSDSSSSYESESEFESSSEFDEYFSDSSSDEDEEEESIESSSDSEEEDIYNVLQKSVTSFVEDEFVTDNEISGAEELDNSEETRSAAVSARSKALIHTLESENAALRASVVALRADWETIVNKMKQIQDGDDAAPEEVTEKSPNLDAIHELRNQALESLNQKMSQDILERKKREADLKTYKECVEELLCENERLYDSIIALSQEREEILQELTSLRKEAVTSLEESHHSGLFMADEDIAKSHEECVDDISALLNRVTKDLSNENNPKKVGNMGNVILQLVSKIMTHRVDIENARSSNDTEGGDAPANNTSISPDSSALTVRRESSRKSSTGTNTDESTNTPPACRRLNSDYSESSGRRTSEYSNSSRRRSSECSESPRRRGSEYSEASRRRSSEYSEASRRRSSGYSDSSRRRSSMYSDSSRPSYSDYSSDSDSEDEERLDEFNVINASMNSLFDGASPSVSSTQDRDVDPPDLGIIYEMFDGSDSDTSSPLPARSKKHSWYNAVRSVASRMRKNDKQRTGMHFVEDEDEVITRDSRSRRSSVASHFSDVELTYYPEIMSRCSPSTASRSSSLRTSRSSKSPRQTSFASSTSSNFSSIKEDDEISLEEDRTESRGKGGGNRSPVSSVSSNASANKEDDEVQFEKDVSELNEDDESQFSVGTPPPPEQSEEKEDTPAGSIATRKSSNATSNPTIKMRRTLSTCASVSNYDSEVDNTSYATSGSESTKERKGITITVVSRSSRFMTLPSSRSHTYVTFFTASLLKDQIDQVLQEQYYESMQEINRSMSSVTTKISSGAKKKRQKYQGDINEEGERHGYGIYKSKNGNEYRGEWQHNKRVGLGVVKIGNGDVFEGQFDNNMKNGIGVYHYVDGECDLSRYVDDQRVGDSLRYTHDRKRAFLLMEDSSSKELSLDEASMEARGMGVIIQL
ncbi:hypothetical protein HJC23_013301 [Cyclotella cryptica]|uniref:Uncharacterized protein n=1 Tax=Cyclotella cryptica TaxID=29204 RepID=A0ABD3NLK2_9STRA